MCSDALSRLVGPHQRYGYDLIVHVGLARYLRGKQREEIRAELYRERGFTLSDGSISNLCDRFLVYFEALHLTRVSELRRAMQEGYPLHLDATCEHGKGGLFVCMDGWRGWVLMATRISSEHEDYLRPLVEKTVALFGDPIATVRDMGEGMARAVAPLRARGVPDFICHYHFLGAVGKKLFEKPYRALGNLLRQHKVQGDLRILLRELRQYRKSSTFSGRFGAGPIHEDLPALVLWILEGEGKKVLLYPFSLPYLELLQRCQQALRKAECWVPSPRTPATRRAIAHLTRLVNRLERDTRFATMAARLEKGWQAFCELRDVLQLTNAELPNGDHHHQIALPALEARRLKMIEEVAKEYEDELRERTVNSGNDDSTNPSPTHIILKYFERYGKHLFGHPTLRDEDGTILAVVERTDNVPEHFFGAEKRKLRRRLGRAHLGRDLEDQPAQAALVANLQHPEYVRVVCGSLDNLITAFVKLDVEAFERTTPLLRNNRDSALFRRVRVLVKNEDKAKPSDDKIGKIDAITTEL
ncbi:MAG: hypothetical protein OES09_15700 [Gammaproteobacteria bacterium]|nr:hypothetical protein [Gammaproteobacteria bacterium]